jgi:hypothetical protein
LQLIPGKGRRRRQTTRQARRLDKLRFQISDYPHEEFDESYEEYFGWYDSEDEDEDADEDTDEDTDEILSPSQSSSVSVSYLDWWAYSERWDLHYLPGRDEYEVMNVEPCPLCGGDCMYLVKKEVMEDLDDIKWRDPFFPYNMII